MAPHPDLDSEQAYIEHAYDRLDAMRASASATLRDAFSQNAGGISEIAHKNGNPKTVVIAPMLAHKCEIGLGERK